MGSEGGPEGVLIEGAEGEYQKSFRGGTERGVKGSRNGFRGKGAPMEVLLSAERGSHGVPREEGVLMGCRNIKGGGVRVLKGPETGSGRGVKGCRRSF